MSAKTVFRTFRNVIFRNRPYFAHLALTHRCNLKCTFCQIPEERVKEFDTDGMKRVIDKLDNMGIAYLSISGGGEPLLRPDFATIINYAVGKGLVVKITSNGTMPRAKYAELLASGVSDIGISIDGVAGNELPFAHVGPKVLESIAYLNDNLPKGKLLTLNITVSQSNLAEVDDIVSYCTRQFPKARLWLNPVVVGQGKLRVATENKVNPNFLRRVWSPTLLTPNIFRDACDEYYRSETYNWGCLAGEFFFDIKPNGDFWICQDHPAKSPLNIMDSDFDRKYREADFSNRRDCSGCTYSCYWMSQKSFELRSWHDIAAIWWRRNTHQNEAFHETVDRHGKIAGFAHFCATRMYSRLHED
jgi:MoaA/NifB/PqqE/SkfB family radical SAM enzyme